jgi:ABC-type multidrug transport system ATPase subunit
MEVLTSHRQDVKKDKKTLATVAQAIKNNDDPTPDFNIGAQQTALTWHGLSVTLPNKKVLVDNISGMVKSGRVLALMGPSGAGKTTLLNALSRRAKYAKVTGEVKFAGRHMTPTDLTYVPQFDEVNGSMTVEEHLLFVGSLTCTDLVEMRVRLVSLLDVLGLTGKKDTPVSGLSGGEVKRVSIGLGLISAPYVLFLDGKVLFLLEEGEMVVHIRVLYLF